MTENIDFNNITFTKSKKISHCSKCGSAEHTVPMCPANPCTHCKQMGHVSSSCPVKKEEKKEKERKRICSQLSEQTQHQ